MDNLTKFGERLNEFITDDNKNATTFAKSINTNATSVCEYVRGLHYPSTKILYAILEYFNCSADYILGLTDEYNEETVYKPIPPFGERFREVMKFCGFTQYRLEKELKISGHIVYNWLFNDSLPTVDNLIKLSKHMGCTVDFLIGRTN